MSTVSPTGWNVPFHLTGRGITNRPMGQADGNPIFCIDAARFSGKVSPVHHFWHTFDLAHTRFSDRHVDQPPTVDP